MVLLPLGIAVPIPGLETHRRFGGRDLDFVEETPETWGVTR